MIQKVFRQLKGFSFSYKSVEVVQFNYFELLDPSSNLNDKIEKAYGSHGVGLSIVTDIPNYTQFRQRMLPLAYQLANLNEQEIKKLERPESWHSKGWSCGVEQFKGKFDKSKGSFYNNPLYDVDEELPLEEQRKLGESMKLRIPNVWPNTLPELEVNFKALGRLMVDTGALLAQHIDKFVHSKCSTYDAQTLYRIIKQGDSHCGRLLHYYASKSSEDWCGWHNDHSALTALTAPIYMTDKGEVLNDYSDKTGGLFAKNRFSDVIKVPLKKEALAFQIGETLQILSGGIVEATPHCVRFQVKNIYHKVIQGEETQKLGLNRNTFAVFMAPMYNKIMNPPEGIDADQVVNKKSYNIPPLQGRWKKDISFFEFSSNTYKTYAQNNY